MVERGERALRVSAPQTTSVGIPAVRHAMGYALREMGPVRGARTLLSMNQASGFDCPGCAWPDPVATERSVAEFCENGAKAAAWEATTARVDRDFFAAHSIDELRAMDDHTLEHFGRLAEPVHLAPGATHYAPIAWDDAFALVAERLRAMPSPDRETIGIGKGAVTLEDITDHAELIVVVGQNPGTNHPRMLTALEAAKRRGARIVAINPLPEAGLGRFKNPQSLRGLVGSGTQLTDRHLAVRVNGDLALFAATNKALLEREDRDAATLDRAFIETHTSGFEAAAAHWRALEWSDLERLSGLARAEIEAFASDAVAAKSVVVTWAMGLTQHRNAVATIREIVNFLLLRGNIGRPGAGPSPIRGHSNVQGDRTMGIWEKAPDAFLDRLRDEFGFEPPREHGYDTVGTIRALRDGLIDVFVALGGNFVAATPDTAVTEAAMANTALSVHVATKLNRSHLTTGREALILPCLGRSERDRTGGRDQVVTVEDSMAMVHASRGRLEPGSPDLRSEVDIVTSIGAALFGDDLGWTAMGQDYAEIRRHIERVVPGFESYEERVSEPGGFQLPRPPRDSRTFPTSDGTAHFSVNEVDAVEVPEGHLLLQTLRSHDQFNTTVYGLDDRYRGIRGGRRVVFVNRADLAARGLADGDLVDLVSVYTDGERRASAFRAVAYPTPPGCAAAYFPEANVLVPLESTAIGSNTPTSKSVVIRLERCAVAAGDDGRRVLSASA
ncbi:MAG: hypothetical protein B7Z69_04285 [Actinobacteria bacterium 21-73-9]|nr:MAG: hypothetical protein B7Z69_04285 [Actinobacteria bacterium 21-73-9]